MNYLVFTGISQLDNIFTQNVLKLNAKKLLDDDTIKANKDSLIIIKGKKDITYKDSINTKQYKMSIIIICYNISRILYKAIYFYLLPYLIIPLSYYLYLNSVNWNYSK